MGTKGIAVTEIAHTAGGYTPMAISTIWRDPLAMIAFSALHHCDQITALRLLDICIEFGLTASIRSIEGECLILIRCPTGKANLAVKMSTSIAPSLPQRERRLWRRETRRAFRAHILAWMASV